MSRCPVCGRLADVEPSAAHGDTSDAYMGVMFCECSPEPFIVSRSKSDPEQEWERVEVTL